MVALELRGFEVDSCLDCRGIWLDSGELEVLLDNKMPERLLNIDGPTIRSRRRCPVCSKKMNTAKVGTTKVSEIDTCPIGHGLWFDRGELETIVLSLDEPVRSTVIEELQAIFSRG